MLQSQVPGRLDDPEVTFLQALKPLRRLLSSTTHRKKDRCRMAFVWNEHIPDTMTWRKSVPPNPDDRDRRRRLSLGRRSASPA
jgi:hypothetical protein